MTPRKVHYRRVPSETYSSPNEVVEKVSTHLAAADQIRQHFHNAAWRGELLMARYKTIDTSPRFIALDLERQLLPGTFEHALILTR